MIKQESIQNAVSGVLVICALVVTALVVRREFASPAVQPGRGGTVDVVREWRDYATHGRRKGPAGAPVTIVEFSDFQCPFCRVMAARLDTLQAEFAGQVAVVYRHFPLDNHMHAVAAAKASECAGDQGRFWEMHDALFQTQDSIGESAWERYAGTAGISDLATFRECMARDHSALGRDLDAGQRLDVRSTPTVLINQQRIRGAAPLDSLRMYVRRALPSGSPA